MRKYVIVLFAICLIAMMVVPGIAIAGDNVCDGTQQHLHSQDCGGVNCSDILHEYLWGGPPPHVLGVE